MGGKGLIEEISVFGVGWNLLVEALGEDKMLLAVADCSSKCIIPWNRAAPRVDGEEIKLALWEKGWICLSNLSPSRGPELTPVISLYVEES